MSKGKTSDRPFIRRKPFDLTPVDLNALVEAQKTNLLDQETEEEQQRRLDSFAEAALISFDRGSKTSATNQSVASIAYDLAEAMMTERATRDSKGVKRERTKDDDRPRKYRWL